MKRRLSDEHVIRRLEDSCKEMARKRREVTRGLFSSFNRNEMQKFETAESLLTRKGILLPSSDLSHLLSF